MRSAIVVILSLFALVVVQPEGAFAQAQGKKAAAKKKKSETAEMGSAKSYGSSSYRRNVAWAELLGRGGVYSLGYDYGFHEKVSVGLGISVLSVNSVSAILVPVYANIYPLENTMHRLMLSVGVTPVFASRDPGGSLVEGKGLGFPIGVGYEYRGENGFIFRASPYLYVGNISSVWFGLGGGYAW